MKNFILLYSVLSLLGCSTHMGYKIGGEGRSCFSKKELTIIIENQLSKKSEKTTDLFFEPIVVSSKGCVGLYGYVFKNLTVPHRVIQKVLRFEDKIFIYSPNDAPSNEAALIEFADKYNNTFTTQQIEELSKKFIKGTETDARLY